MNNKINVLLTAIGCPGGPSIIQNLKQDKNVRIIGTDIREQVCARYLVDSFYSVPPGMSDNYIDSIEKIVNTEQVDVILPLATYELSNLSRHKNYFNKIGVQVCVSDINAIEVANNKHLLYERYKKKDFIPKYYTPGTLDELYACLNKLGFPLKRTVIKPFISHGSIGLRIIDDSIDLHSRYWNEKSNSTYLNSNMLKLIFGKHKIENLLAMEYIPGAEYGVDLFLDPKTHKTLGGLVRNNGEVFHSEVSYGKLVANHELLKIAAEIAEDLNLSYCVNIDIKLDENNNAKLLEINPRLPATSFLGSMAGVNFPLMSVYAALGQVQAFKEIDYKNNYTIFSYRGFAVVSGGKLVGHVID